MTLFYAFAYWKSIEKNDATNISRYLKEICMSEFPRGSSNDQKPQ